MNVEKKLKLSELILIIVSVALCIVGSFSYKFKYEQAKIKFLEQWLSEKASYELIKWTDYYGVDWLKSFSILMTETNGDKYCKGSKGERGYYQPMRKTALMWMDRLSDKMNIKTVYDEAFQCAGGALHIKSLLELQANDDWVKAVEMYNVGASAWKWRGIRNGSYVKKWCINYTFFKTEWKNFKVIF